MTPQLVLAALTTVCLTILVALGHLGGDVLVAYLGGGGVTAVALRSTRAGV